MIIQMIFGIIVVILSMICGTVIMCKSFEEKRKEDNDRRAAIKKSTKEIITDEFRLAYEEEREKREQAETKLKITQTQLERARAIMAQFKIKEA